MKIWVIAAKVQNSGEIISIIRVYITALDRGERMAKKKILCDHDPKCPIIPPNPQKHQNLELKQQKKTNEEKALRVPIPSCTPLLVTGFFLPSVLILKKRICRTILFL